jgi:hypothetical protein
MSLAINHTQNQLFHDHEQVNIALVRILNPTIRISERNSYCLSSMLRSHFASMAAAS